MITKIESQQIVQAVHGYLEGLQKNNHRKAWKHTQKTWKSNHRKKDLKRYFFIKPLGSFMVYSIKRKGEAMCDVWVNAEFYIESLKKNKDFHLRVRVLCEKKPYKPSIEGKWGVNPDSVQ